MSQSIVIVGGGTSGWMTAAYLKKALPAVSVTVLESPQIRTIGVGEATFSTVKLFFDFLGLSESAWMPKCNASYKLAIRFVNWTAQPGYFYHPFQRLEVVDGFNLAEWWLRLKKDERPFDAACFTTAALCDNNRSPRSLDGDIYNDDLRQAFDPRGVAAAALLSEHRVQYPYGYHFDAALLADYLRDYALERGVRHLADQVLKVEMDEQGAIKQLLTEQNGAVRGDLYVDCTGFRGLLINQTLQEPFVSFADHLPNDSAVALQVPYVDRRTELEPFTTAFALSSGWRWKIPLYNRVGTGYVYCSQFIDPSQAEAELRAHIGPAAEGCRANHIKMRIGRCRNSWVKNCVAVGLASGFVEPLESTGIFFIQHAIEELVSHYNDGAPDDDLIADYNRVIAECIDGVRDFLVLHYYASDRDDTPFWRATKDFKIPESLDWRVKLWKKRLPGSRSINVNYHGFEAYSYAVMLMGLNYLPGDCHPALSQLDPGRAETAFEAMEARSASLVRSLPPLEDYLMSLHEERVLERSF